MSGFDSFFNTSYIRPEEISKIIGNLDEAITIKGKNFVFTGKLISGTRAHYTNEVETKGGYGVLQGRFKVYIDPYLGYDEIIVQKAVSKNTDYLVAADNAINTNFITNKVQAAKRKGTTIVTETEFLKALEQ